jgi:hypothetical protein
LSGVRTGDEQQTRGELLEEHDTAAAELASENNENSAGRDRLAQLWPAGGVMVFFGLFEQRLARLGRVEARLAFVRANNDVLALELLRLGRCHFRLHFLRELGLAKVRLSRTCGRRVPVRGSCRSSMRAPFI